MQLGWQPNLLLIQPINFSLLFFSLKRVMQKVVELLLVVLSVAGGSRSGDGSAGVLDLDVLLAVLFGQTAQSRLEEVPAASVLLLFLGPDNLSVLWILLELSC